MFTMTKRKRLFVSIELLCSLLIAAAAPGQDTVTLAEQELTLRLSQQFQEAVELFEASTFAREAFGPGMVEHYAHFFRTEERAYELKRFAQEHLVEEALRRAFRRGKVHDRRRREAHDLANRLGLAAEAAKKVEERLRRRLGL